MSQTPNCSPRESSKTYATPEIVSKFKTILKSLFTHMDLFLFLSIDAYQRGDDRSKRSRLVNKGMIGQDMTEACPLQSPEISKKTKNLEEEFVREATDISSSKAEERLQNAVSILKNSRMGHTLREDSNMQNFLRNTIAPFSQMLDMECFGCMYNLYANQTDPKTRFRAATGLIYMVFLCYLVGEPLTVDLQAFSNWIKVKELRSSSELTNLHNLRFFGQFGDEDALFPTHYESHLLFPTDKSGEVTAHIDVNYEPRRKGGEVSHYGGAYIKVDHPMKLADFRAISLEIRGSGALETVYLEVKAYDKSPHETFRLPIREEFSKCTFLIREFKERMPAEACNELTFVIKLETSFSPDAQQLEGYFELRNLQLIQLEQ